MSKQPVVIVTIGLAVPAFVLARVISPDPPGASAPPPGLLSLMMVPAVFEALAFGAVVAFLIAAGRVLVRNPADRPPVAAYVSAAWAQVSWGPHSNMRRANATLEGLSQIDWVFHLTLTVGAEVIGMYLHPALLKTHAKAVGQHRQPHAAQAVP